MNRSFSTALTVVLLGAGLLLAPVAALSQKKTQPPPSLREKNYQGVPYVSGGIGEGEREALKRQEANYNLKVVHALAQGNYLALVDTTVKDDQDNTVLQTTAEGPWLYAELPAGNYRIIARTMQGQTQEREVKLPEKGRQEVTFTWQRRLEEAATPRR